MSLRLITIGFSHYCEKARWALDRAKLDYVEHSYAPLLHYLPARVAGGHSVPVLVDTATGKTFLDSTDIVLEVDRRCPEVGLLPSDPKLRAECLEIEEDLDTNLGPATRRIGYFFLVHRGGERFGREMIAGAATGVSRVAASIAYPALAWTIARSLKADEAGFVRSKEKADAVFARMGARLVAARAEGRSFLVGDRFTVADLTLAALCTPLVQPKNAGWPMPPHDLLPTEAAELGDAFAQSETGKHVLRMYETERNAA